MRKILEKDELMKKIGLILGSLLLVTLIVGLGWFLVNIWQEKQVSDFIQEKQEVLAPQGKEVLQEGNVGDTHVLAYLPIDDKGQRIVPIEEAIQGHVRELIGEKAPTGKVRDLLFVTSQKRPTNFSKVQQIELKLNRYKVGYFQISEETSKVIPSLLLTDDNQVLTLEQLFTNKEAAKEILVNHVKTALEAKGTPVAQATTYLEKVRQLDLKTVDFSYDNSQLMFSLPEQEVGIATAAINVSDLFDVLESSYLSEEDQKKYEAYQEEKARKAREKMIALTFDDGPNPATTTRILDLLKKYNAKATFFVLGQNIAGNEEILKRMVAEGHEVANHSFTHPNLTTLSPEQVKQEIEQAQVAIEKVIGKRPTMMRPPYGAVNQTVMNTMNLPAIYWSVDSLDWKSRNPQAILSVIQANTHPGSIILMHDIREPTADSLEPVLQYLQSQGYVLGTMTDLVGKNLNPQYVYYDRTSAGPVQ